MHRLATVAEKITDGSHNPPKGIAESDFLMLSSKNVFDDIFHYDAPRYLTKAQFQQEDKRTGIVAGDVLLTIVGTVGRCAVVPPDAPHITLQRSVAVIRPKTEMVASRFLMYALQEQNPTLNSLARGVAQKGVYLETLRELNVALPPLPEQQRIAAILDEAFESIATARADAEKNLRNARAIFDSYLDVVFMRRGAGWVETTLGDIAQVKGGKRVPKGYKLLSEPTAFPYLRVSDFNDTGSIDTSDLRYVSPEVHRVIKNYVIRSDDLYISIAGTIGKTGIVPTELDGANLTENACRLVFNQGISNRFVYYFTKTAHFVQQAGLNTRTSAQPKLALSRLSTIRLGIPPLIEQEQFADEFKSMCDETRRLESVYQRKLDTLDTLKQSLLHHAFSGQL